MIIETDREQVINNLVQFRDLADNALKILMEQEQYPKCEKCGKEIKYVETSVFNNDGTDSYYRLPVTYECKSGCVMFTTTPNWTGYNLTDAERKEGIRCPYCGEFPFDNNAEIVLHEPVNVMMWKSS